MPPLAQAFVRLRSDSSMLATDVRRDAERAGTVGGTTMGRSFTTSLRRTANVVAGLGLATFAVEAGRFAIGMADKFELSRARIETVTKNIGGNVQAVDEQVQALDERMAKFGFTNADVEGSVASLTSATKDSAKAMKDTALAVDIARGRNMSLESATSILMRVETGHVAMLSRLGIATKDANGNLLTQREALQQLAQVYGGSASRFADTFAGKQAALRAELGNSAAEIGAALLPAAADLARVLQHDVLPPVISATHWFDKNRKTIEPLVGVVLKLYAAYKLLGLVGRVAGHLRPGTVAGPAGGAGANALSAFSVARPLPVYVVNNIDAGAPLPLAPGAAGEAGKVPWWKGRGGLIGLGAGAAASFAGAEVGGRTGSVLSGVGTGAMVGSVLGPEGAAAGAVVGGAVSLGNSLNGSHFNPATLATMAQTKAGRQQLEVLIGSLKKAGIGSDLLKAAQGALATAEAHTAQQAAKETTSLTKQSRSLKDAQSRSLALSSGQDALRQAIHSMATTAEGSGKALRGNSDAALANRDSIRGAVQAGEAYIATLKAQHVGAGQVRAAELAVAKAIQANATATYGNRDAVNAMLRSLHMLPSQVKAALSDTYAIGYNAMTDVAQGFVKAGYQAQVAVALASASLNKQVRLGLSADHAGTVASAVAPPPVHLAYMHVGASLGGDFSNGYSSAVTPSVANTTKDAAKQAAKDAAKAARQEMRTFFSQIKSDIASEKASLIGTFAQLSNSARTDSLGASGPPASALSQLNSETRQMDTFTRLWLRLDREGLNPKLLDIFEGEGPAAIGTMRLWASHKGLRRRANRDIGRISRDAGRLATRDVSDASNGDIVRELRKLPDREARALRHALEGLGVRVTTKRHSSTSH